MTEIMVIQEREIGGGEIARKKLLMADRTQWGRTRLSLDLCEAWNWRNALGRPKAPCLPVGRGRRNAAFET